MSKQQEEQHLSHKKQQEEQRLNEQQKKQEAGLLKDVVRDSVLSVLGPPPELQRVQVTCVWGDHYRVNIFVGPDVTSCKVAHSYFLEADGNGKILSSCPAITKAY